MAVVVVVVVVYHLRENEASRHALWNGFPAARGGGDKEVYINTSIQIITKALTKLRPISGAGRCGV